MKKILLASTNKGKIKEIREMLSGYEIVSIKEVLGEVDIEENGTTFIENAIIKAKTACELSGLDAIADDSGLCVEALNNEPGIYSARYSGKGDDENNQLVLKNMQGKQNRDAKFCCAMVYYRKDKQPIIAYGETKGYILNEVTGTNGFGYDAIFYSYELNMPMGYASAEQKNSISHRGRALRDLYTKISKL